MYRQMMKRKHPSSTPILDEREARMMADQVADKLARCITIDGEPKNLKKRRTIPLHDPFFVGTPEEETRHLQRLRESLRKRKSEDYTPLADASTSTATVPELLAANLQRLNKVARRSKAQAAAVDIDALNRRLSSVGINDTTTDDGANPCKALVLYTPNPLSRPTITVEEPDDAPEHKLPYSLRRYGSSRFALKVEDLSKALIIYPEEHPLQEVIDKIKDYERRAGKSNVKIEELTTSLDDIDDDDDHSLRMLEETNSSAGEDDESDGTSISYVIEPDEDADGDDEGESESIAQADEEAGINVLDGMGSENQSLRFEELDESLFPPPTSASSSTSTTTTTPTVSFSFAPSTPSYPFPSPPHFAAAGFSSPSSPFIFSAASQLSHGPPPTLSSPWPSTFLSSPPVFSNVNPFASAPTTCAAPPFSYAHSS